MDIPNIILLTLNPVIFLGLGVYLGYNFYPKKKIELRRKEEVKKVSIATRKLRPDMVRDNEGNVGLIKPTSVEEKNKPDHVKGEEEAMRESIEKHFIKPQ